MYHSSFVIDIVPGVNLYVSSSHCQTCDNNVCYTISSFSMCVICACYLAKSLLSLGLPAPFTTFCWMVVCLFGCSCSRLQVPLLAGCLDVFLDAVLWAPFRIQQLSAMIWTILWFAPLVVNYCLSITAGSFQFCGGPLGNFHEVDWSQVDCLGSSNSPLP